MAPKSTRPPKPTSTTNKVDTAGADAVEAYISGFEPDVQAKLQQIRATMKVAAPDATEAISYGVPALRANGKAFIFFAGYRRHLSVYPAPRGDAKFADELSEYKGGKGTMQIPLDVDVPVDLISRITKFRLDEVM